VGGGLTAMLEAARAALLENPDVLVLQELNSAPLVTLALEAAAAGHLVIAGMTTPGATGAIERILQLYPPDQQPQIQRTVSLHLRAIIGQVLVPRTGGGRIVAREMIFTSPAVAKILSHGKVTQLRALMAACRDGGSVPLTDALVDLVRSGAVEVADAYPHAPDAAGFLERIEHASIDRTARS
jgi:twitching motility protein PilT